MLTYQDFEKATDKLKAIQQAILYHKGAEAYQVAIEAEAYYRQQNTEILKLQKYIYNDRGQSKIDVLAPNNKIASNFFNQFVTQEVQYLLGNGIYFHEETVKEKLGKKFDVKLQDLGLSALIQGVSFGFWNCGRLEIFKYTEFVPLFDEKTSQLKAGIRFWQIDSEKPLYITLYEADGITEFVKTKDGKLERQGEKKRYITTITRTAALGVEGIEENNYDRLPIFPLYGNRQKTSEFVGCKNTIDLYDRIFSDFGNDFDRANQLYWILENYGGMDKEDLLGFQANIKNMGIISLDSQNGGSAELKTIEIPYQARQVALQALEDRLYQDFGALNVSKLSAGAKTATEIKSAYMPLDMKADGFEYCVIAFVQQIARLLGFYEVEPMFTRNRMVNELEYTQQIMLVAPYLDDRTILKKLPFIADDEIEEILKEKEDVEIERFNETPKSLE